MWYKCASLLRSKKGVKHYDIQEKRFIVYFNILTMRKNQEQNNLECSKCLAEVES